MIKYSLANYLVTITPKDENVRSVFDSITIGGSGTTTSSIELPQISMWRTDGYSTGGYVHNKTYDRHGSISITINQLSDDVSDLIKLFTLYCDNDYDGFTISVTDIAGNHIADCIDCFLEGIPRQAFSGTASNQTWSFTCGQINYN